MMSKDMKELLRALNAHSVKYIVIGGYAYGVHLEPRATKDLDLFIRADEENSQAIFQALAEFGAPLEGIGPADFRDGTVFQIGQPPERIGILQRIEQEGGARSLLRHPELEPSDGGPWRGLSPADRGGVGVCLPGGDRDALLVRG